MIAEPKCSIRNCKHFLGVKSKRGFEHEEKVICKAFPDGIPGEIAYGDNPHLEPIAEQKNKIVFEELENNHG